jgi:hypothetical protein
LGSPGIFVVSEEIAATLPADHLVPAVDTDDIVAGVLQAPKRYAIRTRPDIAPPPAIQRHLDANMHRMAKRGLQGKPWLPPERFHNMDLSRPSLLVPRIARAPVAILLPAGVLPINHNLSIVSADEAQLDRIRRYLATESAAQWVNAHAAPLEGGYFSLTTSILRKLPIPNDFE